MRGTGTVKTAERHSCHPAVVMDFQKNAWADGEVCCRPGDDGSSGDSSSSTDSDDLNEIDAAVAAEIPDSTTLADRAAAALGDAALALAPEDDDDIFGLGDEAFENDDPGTDLFAEAFQSSKSLALMQSRKIPIEAA